MTKRKEVDWMKYMPLAVMAVSLISGYTLLQARVANCEDKLKSYEIVQTKLSNDTSDIKVSEAKVSEKVNLIYEAIKDLKK